MIEETWRPFDGSEHRRPPYPEGQLLAPCAFCGGRGYCVRRLRQGYEQCRDDPDAYAYTVRCQSCAAEGPWTKSGAEGAVARWNRRVER